jgi:hypothetical protein
VRHVDLVGYFNEMFRLAYLKETMNTMLRGKV